MTDVKRLVYSIIQFLGQQIQSGTLSADAIESLEVTIQCLESAYNIDHAHPTASASLRVSKPLLDIFAEATKNETSSIHEGGDRISEADKGEAERLKVEGNNLMKADKYLEAVDYYTRAIAIDKRNAIYYSNRAAAYSKLNNHKMAIEDCKAAIEIDPMYSKAYGRMGLAFASLNQHQEARECYEKAVSLEPQNDSYLNNLKVAIEKLGETNLGPQATVGGIPGFGLGGFDLNNLLTNPALVNMATQMMSDPNMQQMMGTLLSGSMGGNQGASPGFEALLQAGQQLAAQMQATNPQLVEQLRQHMSPGSNEENANADKPGDQNNPGL